MTASLIISALPYDLCQPSSPLVIGDASDFGSTAQQITMTTTTILDGALINVGGSALRTVTLPIIVQGVPSYRLSVVNALILATRAQTWTFQFTPDGGFPLVFTCSPALVARTSTGAEEAQGVELFTLTFQAQPFGLSSTPQTINLVTPPVVFDSFDTAPTSSSSNASNFAASQDTSTKTQGTASTQITGQATAPTSSVTVSRALSGTTLTAANTSAVVDILLKLSLVGTARANGTLMFTGASGAAYYYQSTAFLGTATASFQQLSFDLTSQPISEQVNSYSLTINLMCRPGVVFTIHVDNARITSGTSPIVSDAQGALSMLPNILGTARTAGQLTVSMSDGSTFGELLLHRPPPITAISLQANTAACYVPINATTSGSSTPGGRYEGTYDIYVSVGALASSTAARTFTVTLTQTTIYSTVLTVTVPYASLRANSYVHIGQVSLPLQDYPVDSMMAWQVGAASSQADYIQDVLLLDTEGQTVLIDGLAGSTYMWVDPPTPAQVDGGVYYGTSRATALSAVAPGVTSVVTGPGPALFDPGPNVLLAHSAVGKAPQVMLTYTPAWVGSAAA